MSQSPAVPLVLIAALGGAGWVYREPIMAFINPPPPPPPVSASSSVAPHKDTVYVWVDKEGVKHFDQDNGSGKKAVEIDQSRIQSMSKYGQSTAAAPAAQHHASAAPSGQGGSSAGSTPRDNPYRAENRFHQTQQDYVP